MAPVIVGVETGPVVNGSLIDEREVVVTSDQPLGVWHVGGLELAPLLTDLAGAPDAKAAALEARISAACAGDRSLDVLVRDWLNRHRVL